MADIITQLEPDGFAKDVLRGRKVEVHSKQLNIIHIWMSVSGIANLHHMKLARYYLKNLRHQVTKYQKRFMDIEHR